VRLAAVSKLDAIKLGFSGGRCEWAGGRGMHTDRRIPRSYRVRRASNEPDG
jgi:hypothetical protein